MRKDVGLEEIEVTKGEKFLAVILAVFMLIGWLWVYYKPLDRLDESAYVGVYSERQYASSADRAAIEVNDQAKDELASLQNKLQRKKRAMEEARESYRTELDAGRPAPERESAYRSSQATVKSAGEEVSAAEGEVLRTAPAASAARKRVEVARKSYMKNIEDRAQGQRRLTFVLRLVFTLALLAFGYWLIAQMRRRHSRYMPVAMSTVGSAAALALVLAGDYISDYIDVGEDAPLVLSIAGIALTLAAIVALQRYIKKRTPQRRVRRRECPFCGYPVRENQSCEGCGRQVVAECSSCNGDRRVGTNYCGACGKA